MNLQEQIAEFRRLLAVAGQEIEGFQLHVAGDGFRALLAGGLAEFEVACVASGVVRRYPADGGPGWLQPFAADLAGGVFASGGE